APWQGYRVRGEPPQIQRQLEARLRQFRRRLPRRLLASLALGDGKPPGRLRQQGDVLLQGLARYRSHVHGLYGPWSSFQRQAAEYREARRRLVGRRRPVSGNGALRGRI